MGRFEYCELINVQRACVFFDIGALYEVDGVLGHVTEMLSEGVI